MSRLVQNKPKKTKACPRCGKTLVSYNLKVVSKKDHPWGLTVWKEVWEHADFWEGFRCGFLQNMLADTSAWDLVMQKHNPMYGQEYEFKLNGD